MDFKTAFKPTIHVWELFDNDDPFGLIFAFSTVIILLMLSMFGVVAFEFGYDTGVTGDQLGVVLGVLMVCALFYPITVTILTAPFSAILYMPFALKKYVFKL